MKRNCVINDLTPTEDFIVQGDSRLFAPNKNVQMIIVHPPYHNIVKYSDLDGDGSSFDKIDEFSFDGMDPKEEVDQIVKLGQCKEYTNDFIEERVKFWRKKK